ncbi:TIGR01777 family oxidoreductase [Arsukibacterium sp.]|uniref:TIGR01777 family oxidoreductase n=1 Tax=Arsukibacterium sp. TaxID=1977258 RepID=UPI002FDA3058
MNILITGGTGLIGKALQQQWAPQHQLIILSRQAKQLQLADRQVRYISELQQADFNKIDAVVNLAGEPIADKRWTASQKEKICHSRWQITEQLVEAIAAADTPPHTLISGSAIGFYGRQADQEITEDYQAFYPEFSHDICARWENLAQRAASDKTRVCLLRTGIVLAENGGALKKMLLPFKLGLGGPIGNGVQYMSWVHLQDMIRLIDFLLQRPELKGPFNAVAPKAVTNKVFTQYLAARLHRPALLPMPSFMVKLLFGEMSDILLYGQRVVPKRLLAAGFSFTYPQLPSALAALKL